MRQVAIVLLLALCGCGDASPDGGAPEPSQARNETAEASAAPAAAANAPANSAVAAALPRLPPAETAMRFVGSWAAEAGRCTDQAWRFTLTSLKTPAGSVCRFSDGKPVPGGYDIAARCTAEGPPQDDVIRLRFAESAQAMMFESDSIADAGLVHCGPAG
jgi:hypothetical protein